MMHTRGNRRDFDQWAALGNPGWDYLCSSLLHQGRGLPRLPTHTGDLKYLRLLLIFIMFSGYTQDLGGGDNNRHECQGLPRTRWARRHPGTTAALLRAFIQSGLDLGYSVIDYNGPEQLATLSIKDGVRSSTPDLLPASSDPNLHILHSTTVPTGELLKPPVSLDLQEEVILSAGPVESPKLLMLSGVQDHLHKHKDSAEEQQRLNCSRLAPDLQPHLPAAVQDYHERAFKYSSCEFHQCLGQSSPRW
ncbi:Glucose dehydrogenase [FAD quinone]-like 14 [Homarus americanus]|uniref:Glucose dehydrogenase [FAD quinone]-like 14 n=1 Tax=Homarus americanus TaxID=6706 RepID=A0A8J5JNL7_HOMAM|nr:Glucose dehydrogenase [FAD quinone]-like 14 [Homarus americanus]